MTSEKGDDGRDPAGLKLIRQFSELPDDVIDELRAMCRKRRFAADRTVVHDGEHPDDVGFVLSGVLRMQKTLSDGRQHIVGLLVEGDMFGHVFNGPLHFAIEAATDAEICAFRRSQFEELLMRSPDLERVVLLNVLNELDRARDWMIILSGQKVSGRLAGFLLVMCARFSAIDHLLTRRRDGVDVKIPISRTDLAHLLGTRPESISRAFHALADAGDISILRPDFVRIHDFEALAEKAGEDDPLSNANLREIVQAIGRET